MAEASRSISSSDVIFSINRNTNYIPVNNTSDEPTAEATPDEDSDFEVIIMCMVYRNGKVGAASYNLTTKMLHFYEEMVDHGPDFLVSYTMYREVAPKVVLTFGNLSDQFVTFLIDLLKNRLDETTTTDSIPTLPGNLHLLPKKDYHYDCCRTIISNLRLLSANACNSSYEKEIHLNSLVNFDYKQSVCALGALVKYMDKNWVHFTNNQDTLQYLDIEQTSLKNNLIIDQTTINALQIFQERSHESSFKRGLHASSREGLSLFRLFSAHCKSKLGQAMLRNLLMNPINNIVELNERLEFLSFVLHPAHSQYVESFQDNIKHLTDINKILFKIENLRALGKDWLALYTTINHTMLIYELNIPYVSQCAILQQFNDSITMDLASLRKTIDCAIDFSKDNGHGRPTMKSGIDLDLDAKKLRQADLAKHITAAAQISVNDLPGKISECSIIYLPEMGHFVAINEWESGCNPEELQEFGFRFMFTLQTTFYYKNAICLQLDEILGDLNGDIIAHENRIIQRLSLFVMKFNGKIRNPLKIVAKLDALMAFARVAAQNSYVRPHLNESNTIEISNGRHPLVELIGPYVPNDHRSGPAHRPIKILTGPNGSGKSVHLKQVALVVYLAHVGAYVPAQRASVGMLHGVHSRLQTTESVSVRLSAFMIDAAQATRALRGARADSLVLLDEFGRGTGGGEGAALLMGALRHFRRKGAAGCPHVLVSTHFARIVEHLPQDEVIQYLRMEHTTRDDALLYLYRISEGVSGSFAFEVCKGRLREDVIRRAKEFAENRNVQPLSSAESYDLNSRVDLDFLRAVNYPGTDPESNDD